MAEFCKGLVSNEPGMGKWAALLGATTGMLLVVGLAAPPPVTPGKLAHLTDKAFGCPKSSVDIDYALMLSRQGELDAAVRSLMSSGCILLERGEIVLVNDTSRSYANVSRMPKPGAPLGTVDEIVAERLPRYWVPKADLAPGSGGQEVSR